MINNIKKNDIITLNLPDKNVSNTYFIYDILEESTKTKVILYHPIYPDIFIIKPLSEINKVQPVLQDSYEKCIRFAIHNKKLLSWEDSLDLESISIIFVSTKSISAKNKKLLANICGSIAEIKFDNNIHSAMDCIKNNSVLLDEFNLMWYKNFSKIFSGETQIKSKKQRDAIFNISGFVLAELDSPKYNINERLHV